MSIQLLSAIAPPSAQARESSYDKHQVKEHVPLLPLLLDILLYVLPSC